MKYNVIPLRDVVIYPGIITPLFVGRKHSIETINRAVENNEQILLLSQKSADIDTPTEEDIYNIGTLADVIQVMKLPDDTLKLLVEGSHRATVESFTNEELTECEATILDDIIDYPISEVDATRTVLLEAFKKYIKMLQNQPKELIGTVSDIEDLSIMVDTISSHLQVDTEKKIGLLQQANVSERIATCMAILEGEMEVIDLESNIRKRVKSQMDKNQKEYYLNEQAKAIQKELETLDDTSTDFGKIEQSIKKANMPKEAKEKCVTELEKLKKMPPMSSEAVVLRNYLETMSDYPWAAATKQKTTLSDAQDILEDSHFGLEDVKKRIIEYIAVQQRLKKPSGSILCLVGPPGVGKTSIGKSIAKAINREYVRMALGGVRDEAEIRGHRRTYIGAMPGKIIQNITKSKVSNPLFLLDEIDKMAMDHRGDPASAMLEVLDPEQNHTFNDHYMEVDMDLSNVMFIATANSLDIPGPLLDRMEIIRIPGYTESEKLAIAKQYLLPRNIKRNGLKSKEISITEKALELTIKNYTRESGVRNLDREIGKLCRKVVTQISLKELDKISISQNNLEDYLGVPQYKHDGIADEDSIGRITGLAWTSVGGELLNIEVAILPGKGKVALTGKLGDVMQESVQTAMTVVKSHVSHLSVSQKFFQEHDFHIHLPEAAIPKDGPSAGIAMSTAILSAIMQMPISHQIAMTGEVTLQGNVLPIGGLKEKLFAAVRERISTVLIPAENEKDLADIPDEIKQQLTIIPVSKIEEVFSHVFANKLNKINNKTTNEPLVAKYINLDCQKQQKH